MKDLLLRYSALFLLVLFDGITEAAPGEHIINANSFSVNGETLQSKAERLINEKPGLYFEENNGQVTNPDGSAAPEILFKSQSPGLTIWVTTQGLVYQFLKYEKDDNEQERPGKKIQNKTLEKTKTEWKQVNMILKGARIKKENIITGNEVGNAANYFLAHCTLGIMNVKTFRTITLKDIYPKIDWILKTSVEGNIKYDFVVRPGADAEMIKLIYEGYGKINITNNQVCFENEFGNVTEGKLFCYLDHPDKKVSSNFVVKETKKTAEGFSLEVGIKVAPYDKTHQLVIDPDLQWGTYFGGNAFDGIRGAVADAAGNLFVTGYTSSTNFAPFLNPGGSSYYLGANGGSYDIFIMKFNASGVLQWSTYYGGTGDDAANALCNDGSGNIYITGYTTSDNLPVFNPGSGAYFLGTNTSPWSYGIFILKFSSAGTRLWSTYYGNGAGTGSDICTDASGNIFLTGFSEVSGMPVMNPGSGAYYQSANAGGSDVFVLKFTPAGALAWATYYGGTGYDLGYSIDNDGNGNVFVTGYTSSTNFPVLNSSGAYFQGTISGFFDAFLIKFSGNGARLWATYYGGSGDEYGNDLTTDANGNLFVTGQSSSGNFPVQNAGTYFDNTLSGINDIFILKFSNTGARQWATLYGGSGTETGYSIATDIGGNVYVTGFTASANLPTLDPGGTSYFRGTNSGGPLEAYVLGFSNNGLRLWATYNGTTQSDFGTVLTTSPAGFLFAAGEWQNPGSNGLNNPGGGAFYNPAFAGGDDSFIMKFGIPVSLPLPVELISLSAEGKNNFIHVAWSTASEINNRGFELQRTSDISNFEKISWKDGKGTTTSLTEYFYDDPDVEPEKIYYYRLKQIDFDGSENYSAAVATKITGIKSAELTLTENADGEYAIISWYLPFDSPVKIILTDVSGKQVPVLENSNMVKGNHSLKLEPTMFQLSKGMYFVSLSIPSEMLVRKFFVR